MCSIRNAIVLAGMPVVAMLGTGCVWVKTPPPMQINPSPIVVDEAMQHRDWDRTTCYYPNGVTVAGPTGLYVRADPRLPGVAQGAVETPLFVGQVILLPFDFLWDPPWKDIEYPRAQAPASYTAAPPSDNSY